MIELPKPHDVERVLAGLFARPVTATRVAAVRPHIAACHGLVDNDDELRYVIGGDLAFAHLSGAALAMVPPELALEAGTESPDEDLIEAYHEVANLASRAVNEASANRVRLDPDIAHEAAALARVMRDGDALCLALEIEGYGAGALGIWGRPG